MATRFDGFYYARWEGLDPAGRFRRGQGTAVFKDGKIFGGDSAEYFLGEYRIVEGEEGEQDTVLVNVQIFRLVDAHESVTGNVETKLYELSDIKGQIPKGPLPLLVHARLDSPLYPERRAISVFFTRISLI
jgi:hypothetical protein